MIFNQPSRVFMEIGAVLGAVAQVLQLTTLMIVARNMTNAMIGLDTSIVHAMVSFFSVLLQSETYGRLKEEPHGLFGGSLRQNMTWAGSYHSKIDELGSILFYFI